MDRDYDARERKKKHFRDALVAFEISNRTPDDYLAFIAASCTVLRQGNGISFREVNAILLDVLCDGIEH